MRASPFSTYPDAAATPLAGVDHSSRPTAAAGPSSSLPRTKTPWGGDQGRSWRAPRAGAYHRLEHDGHRIEHDPAAPRRAWTPTSASRSPKSGYFSRPQGRFLPCKSRCASCALEYHPGRMTRPLLAAVGFVVGRADVCVGADVGADRRTSRADLATGRLEEVRRLVARALPRTSARAPSTSPATATRTRRSRCSRGRATTSARRYKLALRARIFLEEELTSPDTPNGRRFYPYDPWFWLAADNLHTFERSKIRIGGDVAHGRAVVVREPLSAPCVRGRRRAERQPRVRVRPGQRRGRASGR